MTTHSPPPTQPDWRSRRPLLLALGGCGALAAAVLCVAIIAAAIFYLRRDQPAARQPAVEYILDASPRMEKRTEGGTRLSVAQSILAEIVRPADPALTAGLRVFGTGAVGQPCQDTRLVVPLAQANQGLISDELSALAAGTAADSALAEAMIAAIRDLAATKGPHSLIVVTGGADTCNPQAGELIAQEAKRAGIDLQTFMIGFDVDRTEAEAIKGMADKTPGVTYLEAPDAGTLRTILATVQTHVDRPTTTTLSQVMAAATPVAAPPSPAPEGYQSQTACDHPYFPLRQGATWQYSTSDGFAYTWTVVSVTGDLNSAAATVTMSFEGSSITYQWACTSEGVTYFQGFSITTPEGYVGTYEVTGQSGASLLAVAGLEPGATWESAYTTIYTFEAEGISGQVTTSVSETNTAGEKQTMTVGGETIEVIPVTSNGTYTTSSSFGGVGPMTSSGTSVVFYGYGVGIVRVNSTFSDYSSTTELASYTIP